MNIPILHFDDLADGEPPCALTAVTSALDRLDWGNMRVAQRRWAGITMKGRLHVIRTLRHAIAEHANALVSAMNPRDEGHAAEMLSSQVIPLADACRFLERNAAKLLHPRRVRGAKPLWLANTRAEIRREPHGIVLVIAPSNYPLFLPAVVIVQAIAAGNAVVLKPAPGCGAFATSFLLLLRRCGLDPDLTCLLGEETEAVYSALSTGVDKVVFTGSARAGQMVLRACAQELVSATVELSGCDAMFVRADADVKLAARALLFGLHLNRGATCIAPRRVFVHESRAIEFEIECRRAAGELNHWQLSDPEGAQIAPLFTDAARQQGRLIVGEVDHHGAITAPLVVADAKPSMRLLREDHFCAAAAIVSVRDDEEALTVNDECPFALGASIFSRDARAAHRLAGRVNAGNVLINDVIVPTADPRVPFGGRKQSGFGVTRGAEGLLELTVTKVVIARRGFWYRHFDPPRARDAQFFSQFLCLTHGADWGQRFKAALALWRSMRARRNTV